MTEVCLTFDVEERFHSHLSVAGAPREFSSGDVLRRLVDWLAETGRRATFFTVGELAEQFPDVFRRMADLGFEVASHSHTHLRLDRSRPEEVAADIARSKTALEQITGKAVRGFRAPTWSAHRTDRHLWELLRELGFTYDSSLFPVSTPMYGSFGNPNKPYWLMPGLMEIPPSAVGFGPLRMPFGGGFYFRLMPLVATRVLIRAAKALGVAPILYFHPWEFEAAEEKIEDGFLKSFIANHGVGANLGRFKQIVGERSTITMADLRKVTEDQMPDPAGQGQG